MARALFRVILEPLVSLLGFAPIFGTLAWKPSLWMGSAAQSSRTKLVGSAAMPVTSASDPDE